ncbi:MAG: hypothetical protein H6816_00870 [Phycisphaerales bacterium]|nr:hypothetical protein [Phycisphaerales bacterium]
MKRNPWRMGIWIVLAGCGTAYGQHQGDVWVGRTATDLLAISSNGFVPEENFAPLSPVSGLLQGWTNDDPGFDHVVAGDALDPLQAGAAIWLEVVAMDPAFQLIDDGFQILHDPGDDTLLGGSTLHEHLTWHINSQDPAFDPAQCIWNATFVLRDDGSTGYGTSAPLTFSFTNAPVRSAGVLATGDFDESGAIDAADDAALAACLDGGGPAHLPEPMDSQVTTCPVECLNAFDFDDDRDVDLQDAAAFQRVAHGG